MADRGLRMSRRRILQLAGVAPFVALSAGTPSTPAFAAGMQGHKKVPDDTMKELFELAKKQKGDVSETAFGEVIEELWQYCRTGAAHAGFAFPLPDEDDKAKDKSHHDLILAAYGADTVAKGKSGDLIVRKLDTWGEQRQLTNVCAFECGYATALAAGDLGKKEVDAEAYRLGFRQTERKMQKRMARLRSVQETLGKDPAKLLGGGC